MSGFLGLKGMDGGKPDFYTSPITIACPQQTKSIVRASQRHKNKIPFNFNMLNVAGVGGNSSFGKFPNESVKNPDI